MKRYYCTDSGSTYESYGEPIMKESDQGDYVKYDDVMKLVEALKKIKTNKFKMGDNVEIVGSRFTLMEIARQTLKELGVE